MIELESKFWVPHSKERMRGKTKTADSVTAMSSRGGAALQNEAGADVVVATGFLE